MTVGILGSTGFVGSNLAKYFLKNNVDHVGGSRKLGVDARNINSILDWIKTNKITQIINLAADCGGIGLNKDRPADLWASSTAISYSVLEASRIAGISKLIMVGTVCSYPHTCPVPFNEDYLMRFGSPEATNKAYGIAKLNSLIGAEAYVKQYDMDITCLIPANMYGRHDNFDDRTSHVIPALIKRIAYAHADDKQSVTLWGDGSPTREFLHVEDFCRAVDLALDVRESRFINIGTGKDITILDLAYLIAKIIGYHGMIEWDATLPNGQPRRRLDIGRAEYLLKYNPTISLEEGLKDTIMWFREMYL